MNFVDAFIVFIDSLFNYDLIITHPYVYNYIVYSLFTWHSLFTLISLSTRHELSIPFYISKSDKTKVFQLINKYTKSGLYVHMPQTLFLAFAIVLDCPMASFQCLVYLSFLFVNFFISFPLYYSSFNLMDGIGFLGPFGALCVTINCILNGGMAVAVLFYFIGNFLDASPKIEQDKEKDVQKKFTDIHGKRYYLP